MAKHMNGNDRCRIEFLLGLRWPVSEIAADRGRPDSTILREILNRRVWVSLYTERDGCVHLGEIVDCGGKRKSSSLGRKRGIMTSSCLKRVNATRSCIKLCNLQLDITISRAVDAGDL